MSAKRDKSWIYETEDKKIELEVNLEKETVWLTQKQMSELFDRDRTVISRHINNIFKEEELEKKWKKQSKKLFQLQKTIEILNRMTNIQRIELDEAKRLLNVVSQYSYALKILDDYDHQTLQTGSVTLEEAYNLSYEESMKIINFMKDELFITKNIKGSDCSEPF